MARADRLARLDIRRADLEAEYRGALIDALRMTAAGRRGLFDRSKDRAAQAATAPIIANLTDLADEVDRLRDQLALPPFDLHGEFLRARGPVAAHAVGEPKQAQIWLDRLVAADGSIAP